MDRKKLEEPFPRSLLRERPGRNGQRLTYVESWAYIQRLNEAVDEWSFEITKHEIIEGEVIVLGKLIADGVVKMAFGGTSITVDKSGEMVSLADDLKAAAAGALRKASSLLGIGLTQLYAGEHQAEAVTPRAGPSQESRVTSRQLAALHSSARKQGLSRDALADIVHERTGLAELSALTKAQASELISELSGSNGGGR